MYNLQTDLQMDRLMDLCTDIASYLITYEDASKTIISTRQSFLFGSQQIMVQEADVSIVSSERLG